MEASSVMVTGNNRAILQLLKPSVTSQSHHQYKQQLSSLTHNTSTKKRLVLNNSPTCRALKTTICCYSTSSSSNVAAINESEFNEVVLKSERPVLVEFVANWCGPCRLVAPSIDSLAQEYKERIAVVKIDHDANPNLIKEYEVYGLPTLILFKNGKPVPDSKREGAITKAKLKEYIDGLLESLPVA